MYTATTHNSYSSILLPQDVAKVRFPRVSVHAAPLSGGAVETSVVHHGRVCPARRKEPVVRGRVSAVGELQVPS